MDIINMNIAKIICSEHSVKFCNISITCESYKSNYYHNLPIFNDSNVAKIQTSQFLDSYVVTSILA